MDKNIATLIAKIIAVAAIAVIGSASTTNSTNRCHHRKPRSLEVPYFKKSYNI